MAAQSILAKLGCRIATLGAAANLAIAFPIAEGDQSMSAHIAANRIGLYGDRTPGAEKMGHVVMGTEVLSVGVASITAAVKLNTPASVVGGAGLNIGQGIAPTVPGNGDVWITASGLFARIAGSTVGPFGTGTGSGNLTGTLTSGRVPYASGTTTLVDSSSFTFDGTTLSIAAGLQGGVAAKSFIQYAVTSGVQTLYCTGSYSAVTKGGSIGNTVPGSNVASDDLIFATSTNGVNWVESYRVINATRVVQFANEIVTVASATGAAGVNLPAGTAPSAPVDGDLWTTTAGLFVRINGGTVGPLAAGGGGITGTLTSGRVPFANGVSSLTDTATLTFSTASGLSFNRAAASGTESFGSGAGNATMTAQDSTLVGNGAGLLLTSGTGSTHIGFSAGGNITTQTHTTFVGKNAGGRMFAGPNIAVGEGALRGSVTVANNTGSSNVAVGYLAMTAITSDSQNVAIGGNALGSQVGVGSNDANVAIGYGAGFSATTGGRSVLVGFQAGINVTTQMDCTFIGSNAGQAMRGANNTAVGSLALKGGAVPASNTGANNTAVGYNSQPATTAGAFNTSLGSNTLTNNSVGNYNIAIGDNALANTTASSNVAVGLGAASNNTSGLSLVAVGTNALGNYQVGTGQIAIGESALLGNATPSNNTGTRNTAIGYQALILTTTGVGNVAIGYSAGALNTTGSGNIFLGDGAGDSTGAVSTNRLVVGSNASPVSQVYFGSGETSTSPSNVLIQPTGGAGANKFGGTLSLCGGPGTGTGTGGSVVFNTAPVTGSGSTPNTQTTRLSILGDGGVKWTGIATASSPAVAGANTGVIFYDLTLQKFRYSVNTGAYADLVVSGGITGTLTSGRVPFANSSSTLTDSSTFTFSTASGLSVNRAGLTGCEFFGSGAGNTSITGNGQNTFVGNGAGNGFVTGDRTVAIGFNALTACTTSSRNVAIGYQAMAAVTLSASDNVAIGYNSQFASTGNVQCVSIGSGTMIAANAKSNCTAVGCSAMGANAGNNNTAIGASAMDTVSSGGSNTALGMSAGSGLLSGSFNIFLGRESGDSTTNSSSNRLVAGSSTSAIASVFIGNGETHATPQAVVYKATGGVGADITGASFTIAGGIGTGAGLGGNIIFQVAPASTSSSTPNALTTGLTINQRKTVDFAFGFVAGIRTTTTTDTAVNTDFTILADTTSAGYTQSLMASPPTGFVINVKKIVAANTLTISGNGKNIDGSATLSVTTLNQSTMMQYDGTQWRVL